MKHIIQHEIIGINIFRREKPRTLVVAGPKAVRACADFSGKPEEQSIAPDWSFFAQKFNR
jgi:hypothetical protein